MRFVLLLATATAATAVDLNALRVKASATYTRSADVAVDPATQLIKRGDHVEVATVLVKKIAPDATFRSKDDRFVGTNGMSHVFFQQTSHGLDIDNAFFNVNVNLGYFPSESAFVIF